MFKSILIGLMLMMIGVQDTAALNEVPLDQEFNLKAGQEVVIQDTKIKVRFASILEDSRCPEGVACAWQGNGKVNLEFKRKKRKVMSVIVNTGTEPREAEYRGYKVRLVRLRPSARAGEEIEAGEYEVTLIVTKL